jgi:hypothetical protein
MIYGSLSTLAVFFSGFIIPRPFSCWGAKLPFFWRKKPEESSPESQKANIGIRPDIPAEFDGREIPTSRFP